MDHRQGHEGPLAKLFAVAPYLGALVLTLQIVVWYPQCAQQAPTHGLDFPIYYDAVQRVLNEQPLYDGWFLYPPTFVAMTWWAKLLPLPAFTAVWYAIILWAFWFYAWALARIAFGRETRQHVTGVGLVLFLTPGTMRAMNTGNADVIVWALAAWAIAWRNNVALLIGAVMKVYTAPAFLVASWRKRDLWTPLLVLPIMTWSIGLIGLRPFRDWFAAGGNPIPTDLIYDPDNIGLPITVIRLLWQIGHRPETAVRFIVTIVPVLAIACTVWWTRRWSIRNQTVALVLMTVWASPVCWTFRLPLALLAGATWMRERRG